MSGLLGISSKFFSEGVHNAIKSVNDSKALAAAVITKSQSDTALVMAASGMLIQGNLVGLEGKAPDFFFSNLAIFGIEKCVMPLFGSLGLQFFNQQKTIFEKISYLPSFLVLCLKSALALVRWVWLAQ